MGYIFDAISQSDQGKAPTHRPKGNTLTPPVAGQPNLVMTPTQTPAPPQVADDGVQPVPPDAMVDVPSGLASPAYREPTGTPVHKTGATTATQPASTGQGLLVPSHHQGDMSLIDDRVVSLVSPSSGLEEEYRVIRTGVLARWHNRRQIVHTITSALPQEGKTLTSINLAFTFAELRTRRTVVIEADLRLPQWSRLLKLEETPGLTDHLRGEADIANIVHTVGESGAHLIPAGTPAGNDAVQLLSSTAMTALIHRLRQSYDHVIIDTPPVLDLADAGIIGGMSDEVLLVVRMNQTPRKLVMEAKRVLTSYNAPIAGVIATDQMHRGSKYYSRYGYRYGYRGRYGYSYGYRGKREERKSA